MECPAKPPSASLSARRRAPRSSSRWNWERTRRWKNTAAKTAVVDCTVRQVHRVVQPDLESPEFLEKFGIESFAALRDRVRENMQGQLERQRERMLESLCMDQILESHPFPIPAAHLERAMEAERERTRNQLMERNMPPEEVERNLLEVEGRLREQTERRVRESILLDRIAEAEDVKLEQEDVERHFASMSQVLRVPPQQLFDQLNENGTLQGVLEGLRRDKTRGFLRESAVAADEGKEAEPLSQSSESAEETS